MSVIVELCEETCPIHSGTCCCEARGHDLPHRVVLIGSREGASSLDRVVIEWRPARGDEHWSTEQRSATGT